MLIPRCELGHFVSVGLIQIALPIISLTLVFSECVQFLSLLKLFQYAVQLLQDVLVM